MARYGYPSIPDDVKVDDVLEDETGAWYVVAVYDHFVVVMDRDGEEHEIRRPVRGALV